MGLLDNAIGLFLCCAFERVGPLYRKDKLLLVQSYNIDRQFVIVYGGNSVVHIDNFKNTDELHSCLTFRTVITISLNATVVISSELS